MHVLEQKQLRNKKKIVFVIFLSISVLTTALTLAHSSLLLLTLAHADAQISTGK